MTTMNATRLRSPLLNLGWLGGIAALFWLSSTSLLATPGVPQTLSEVVAIPAQPVENNGKIEVLEFFAYGCVHCADLEPHLKAWRKRQPKDVNFKRVPVGFEIRGIDSVTMFYTFEAMGLMNNGDKAEKLHAKIFDAVNKQNLILGSPPMFKKWLEAQGINPAKYDEMKNSFAVKNKISRARQMLTDYKIEATPTLVVDGRYSVSQLNGPDRLFEHIDRLIKESRSDVKTRAIKSVPKKIEKKNEKSVPVVKTPA